MYIWMQVTDVDLMQVTTSSDVRYNIGKEMLPTWYSDSRITGNSQDHDEVPASLQGFFTTDTFLCTSKSWLLCTGLIMEIARRGRSLSRSTVRDSLASAIRRQLLSSSKSEWNLGTLEWMLRKMITSISIGLNNVCSPESNISPNSKELSTASTKCALEG